MLKLIDLKQLSFSSYLTKSVAQAPFVMSNVLVNIFAKLCCAEIFWKNVVFNILFLLGS